MGDRQRVMWWHNISTRKDNMPLSRHRSAICLIGLLDKLFTTHGKNVAVWETGRPELNMPGVFYISRLEIAPVGKYERYY